MPERESIIRARSIYSSDSLAAAAAIVFAHETAPRASDKGIFSLRYRETRLPLYISALLVPDRRRHRWGRKFARAVVYNSRRWADCVCVYKRVYVEF